MAKRKTSKAKASRPVKRVRAAKASRDATREKVPQALPRRFEQMRFFPDDAPRQDDAVDADVLRAADEPLRSLPPEVRRSLSAVAGVVFHGRDSIESKWNMFKDYRFKALDTATVKDENRFILDLVMEAVDAGFRAALDRYAAQLRRVPELASWPCKRKVGGDKGREELQRKTEQRYQDIRDKWAEMEARGEQPTNESVARAMKCGRSTVIRAFKSKPKR